MQKQQTLVQDLHAEVVSVYFQKKTLLLEYAVTVADFILFLDIVSFFVNGDITIKSFL